MNPIISSIDKLIEKSYTPGGHYVPVKTFVQRKDGSRFPAIRWRKFDDVGLAKVKLPKSPYVRSIKNTPSFTTFSFIKQTMFILVDEEDISSLSNGSPLLPIEYDVLGDGIYLYNDLDRAHEKAEKYGMEVLPVKVNARNIFYSKINEIKIHNISSLNEQGYDSIMLVRDEPYRFDLFIFDPKNIVVIGSGEVSSDIKKSIEDYEADDDTFLLSKEDLLILKCKPIKGMDIEKGVIKTPMKSDGSVDYDKVPKDGSSSIWVTVTKPGSPLEGRPILITRRPDGLFAITGGSGFRHMQDKEGIRTRTDALRHLVIEGRPEKTRADKELDKINEELKVQQAPLIEKKKALQQEARTHLTDSLERFNEAVGIRSPDPAKIRKHRDEIASYAMEHGLDEDAAYSYSTRYIRAFTKTERTISEIRRRQVSSVIRSRLKEMNEGADEATVIDALNQEAEFRPIKVDVPNPAQFKGLTPEEVESRMGDIFSEKIAEIINPNPLDKDLEDELADDGITLNEKDRDPNALTFEMGEHIEPLDIKDRQSLEQAFSRYQQYYNTRKEFDAVKIRRIDATETTPALIENFRLKLNGILDSEITDEDMAEYERSFTDQWQSNNSALSFYRALGEFWNDDTALRQRIGGDNRIDNSLGGYINSGAGSALAAITGKYTGERADVEQLIDRTSIEAASLLLAYDLRDKLTNDLGRYNSIVSQLEEYNAENQIATERRALARHEVLQKRYATLQRAKSTELLTARDETGMVEGEVDLLVEQKKNLGTALGSMQASAALLNALYIARDAKNDIIEINFGKDIDGATMRLEELGLGDRAQLRDEDPNNIKIVTRAKSLRKYRRSSDVIKDIYDENERIKNDESGAEYDDDGNLVVSDYTPPMWNDTYTDPTGNEREYKSRVEQRNDIEFLKRMGNGLITRVTGAGKTNTSLGFFANKISEDPTYSALVVVPKGRTGQWMDEAKMFTTLDMVVIPEGVSKDERAKVIAGIKPGQVAVINQRDATVSYYDLEALFLNGDLKGMVIDEPQEVASRSISGNMSAATRKLMKMPSENRIALTATPARDNLIEAYDLANWVSHKDGRLGPRTRFQRAYGGYGSGTNAQDTALQQMLYKEISPYLSGGRLTNPSFKINRQDVIVTKSEIQDTNMRAIEAEARTFIQQRKDEFIRKIEEDTGRLAYYQKRFGTRWKSQAATQSNAKARQELLERHENNLSGIMDNMSWADNPKISAAIGRIKDSGDKKHVIFLDNAKQRRAINEGLLSLGYTSKQIKNISASTTDGMKGSDMARRVKEFRTDENTRVIFIDKQSCSGYNLQEGDDLHVLGTPSDAASYLQAQGRLARMPREGDVGIYTYKYDDVPFDDRKWTRLEQQIAILKATAPGLFVGGENE